MRVDTAGIMYRAAERRALGRSISTTRRDHLYAALLWVFYTSLEYIATQVEIVRANLGDWEILFTARAYTL